MLYAPHRVVAGMVIVAQQKLSVSPDDDGAKMTMHFVYLCRAIGALLARGRVRALFQQQFCLAAAVCI